MPVRRLQTNTGRGGGGARKTPRAEERTGIEKNSRERTRKTPVCHWQCAVAKAGRSSKKNIKRSQWTLYKEGKFKVSASGCQCAATCDSTNAEDE